MKRFLVLVVLVSMLICVVGVMGAIIENKTQGMTFSSANIVNLSATPNPVNFNTGIPGSTSNGDNINFGTEGSSVDMYAVISSVTEEPFHNGLKFNGTNWNSKSFTFICNPNLEGICIYDPVSETTSVDVPTGFAAGTYNSTVTYNVNNGSQSFTQNMVISVDLVTDVQITPATVDFGLLIPGTLNNPAVNNPIRFSAGDSNVDMIIVYASADGKPFDTGLKLEGKTSGLFNVTMPCIKNPTNGICAYTGKSANATLDVPKGFRAGTANGVITYIITSTIPPA